MARIKDDEREFRQAMAHDPGADPRAIAARLRILPGRLACLVKRLARKRAAEIVPSSIRPGRAFVCVPAAPDILPFPGIAGPDDELDE